MRQRITKIIKAAATPEEAALEICVYLDDQLELAENGWFDDDQEVEKALYKDGRDVYLSTDGDPVKACKS
jgi:hypothetical protein